MRRRLGFSTAILLLVFVRLIAAQAHKAPTLDEPHHIARGLTYLRGRNVWNGNPPLAHVVMAAPLLLDSAMLPDPAQLQATDDFRLLGQAFLQTVQPRWRAAFFAARLPNMLMLLALLSLVAAWARRWFGSRAGAAVLILCAFDPNLVAHAQLATTDLPVTLFCAGAGYQAWRFDRTGSWRDAAALGAWAGLALSTKFSALFVLALIGLAILIGSWRAWRARLPRAAAAVGVAGLIVWAVYGFQFGPLAGTSLPLPAPDYLGEWLWQSTANIEQHPAFLADRLYTSGTAAYFPLAFLLKTPTAVVILIGAALAGLVVSPRFRSTRLLLPATVFLGYFAAFVFLPLNIGYRHLLPMLPFGYVLIGALFRREMVMAGDQRPSTLDVLPIATPRLRSALALALIGWAAASSLAVFPHDLAYFAEWSGGPARGYRWLVDSSLDWGQDLYALPEALKDEPGPVYVSYFGPTDPRVIGLSHDPLPNWDREAGPAFHPANPDPGLYAISATNLQGVLLPDPEAFDFFRRRPPDGQVGYSILLYRVPAPNPPPAPHLSTGTPKEDAGPEWVAACEHPAFRLGTEQVRQLLGSGPRLVRFDCQQSWVIPHGGPGRYVLPGEMENAVQAWGGVTELIYRRANGFSVYAYDARGFEPPAPPTATFSESFTFLGAHQTAPREVVTFWQIADPSLAPLSIFGHHLAPDGFLIEAADGLGVPPTEWQTGDILLQWHRFSEPLSRDGLFSTGVYNWQTGARLLTSHGEDRVTFPMAALPAGP
jgi:hypothetical protein